MTTLADILRASQVALPNPVNTPGANGQGVAPQIPAAPVGPMAGAQGRPRPADAPAGPLPPSAPVAPDAGTSMAGLLSGGVSPPQNSPATMGAMLGGSMPPEMAPAQDAMPVEAPKPVYGPKSGFAKVHGRKVWAVKGPDGKFASKDDWVAAKQPSMGGLLKGR